MVTVIITAYNVEKWLQRAIDSVIDQTFHEWQLIIVDDGSTDGTAAIADAAAGVDMRVRAIHTANRGAALARATGVAEARSELITFVDADDTLEPKALQWMLGYVSDEMSVVVGGIRRYSDKGSYAVRGAFSGVMTNAEFINGLLMDDFTPSLCGKLFRRQDLLGLGGILDKEIVLNEDLLMLIAALRPSGVLYIDIYLAPKFVDQHPEVRLRQPWVRSANFGFLEFSFDPEPRVELSIRDVIGAPASGDPVVLRAADLVNGRQSWRAAIDPDELERRERVERGGSYYGEE